MQLKFMCMHRRKNVHKGKHISRRKIENSKSANIKIWFFRVYSNLIIIKLEAFLPEYLICSRRVYIFFKALEMLQILEVFHSMLL